MNLGSDKGEEKPPLEQFGVDLTLKARDGKLDPVIGRDSVRRIPTHGLYSLKKMVLLYVTLSTHFKAQVTF